MFKLSHVQVQLHKALVEAVQDANTNAEQAIEDFNSEVLNLFNSDVKHVLEELNVAVENLRKFSQEIKDEAQESFDEKDETWQESNKGSEYAEWIDAWDAGTSIYDVDIDEPQELIFTGVDMNGVDDLEDKP